MLRIQFMDQKAMRFSRLGELNGGMSEPSILTYRIMSTGDP